MGWKKFFACQNFHNIWQYGAKDLGGVTIDLGGGDYYISSPLVIPNMYGNMRIVDGTIGASSSFPSDRYLIELGDAV